MTKDGQITEQDAVKADLERRQAITDYLSNCDGIEDDFLASVPKPSFRQNPLHIRIQRMRDNVALYTERMTQMTNKVATAKANINKMEWDLAVLKMNNFVEANRGDAQ